MKVTVFTPTYNRAYILPKLYGSLKKQTCMNFEWLIIDDGSTDETTKIVKKYQNTKIYSKPNEGIYSARNLGISLCKTKYFIFFSKLIIINTS